MPRPPTPSPIVIPNVLRVGLHHTFTGGQFSYQLHMAQTTAGPLNPNFAEALFSAIKGQTGVTAFYTGHMHSDVALQRVTVTDMRGANNPTLLSTGTALPGAIATAAAPINACLVVTHRTAQSGRSFRGRTYVGGLVAADMLNSRTWNDTVGSAAVAMLAGIDAACTANGGGLVIAWAHLLAGTNAAGGTLPDRPAGSIDITAWDIANPRIDTQRRRLGR
jgi:hypothetical protein